MSQQRPNMWVLDGLSSSWSYGSTQAGRLLDHGCFVYTGEAMPPASLLSSRSSSSSSRDRHLTHPTLSLSCPPLRCRAHTPFNGCYCGTARVYAAASLLPSSSSSRRDRHLTYPTLSLFCPPLRCRALTPQDGASYSTPCHACGTPAPRSSTCAQPTTCCAACIPKTAGPVKPAGGRRQAGPGGLAVA
jgi:hypothetical protein